MSIKIRYLHAHATRSTLRPFNPQIAAFRFDEQVVEVFDDMIERSVPGYRTILAMLTPLAARYATHRVIFMI